MLREASYGSIFYGQTTQESAFDLATDSSLNPYDIQALMPIIQGAGGVVTTADGGDASMGGFVIASGSTELHQQALAVVRGAIDVS